MNFSAYVADVECLAIAGEHLMAELGVVRVPEARVGGDEQLRFAAGFF